MKIENITKSLVLVSAIAIVLNLVRLDLLGTTNLSYLTWNLFLAWIPYIISLCLIKKDMPGSRFAPIFILWLLFFPNAPYLVTENIHIILSSPLLWYDSVLLFFFGWIGLLLGMLSLFYIHQYFKSNFSYLISELAVFAICFVSSFGIYLGRFERWNSWDIFSSPFYLVKHSFYISTNPTGTVLLFIGVFTVFMYSVYKTVYVLVADNAGPQPEKI